MLIDKRFRESLTVDELARLSCFSKFYYIKLFKEAYGTTPIQYLRRRRFQEAQQLLQSKLSVQEICWEVGFNSVQTFILEFNKHYGYTPGQYRVMQSHGSGSSMVIPLCFFRLTSIDPPLEDI